MGSVSGSENVRSTGDVRKHRWTYEVWGIRFAETGKKVYKISGGNTPTLQISQFGIKTLLVSHEYHLANFTVYRRNSTSFL